MKVKEGGKFFLGQVAGVGSKAEVEAQMNELELVLEDSNKDGSLMVETNTAKGALIIS